MFTLDSVSVFDRPKYALVGKFRGGCGIIGWYCDRPTAIKKMWGVRLRLGRARIVSADQYL